MVMSSVHSGPTACSRRTAHIGSSVVSSLDCQPLKNIPFQVKDDEGATPLCHAAFWTHVDVAKDLIDAGADVNVQRRNDGFTPLHVAAKNNQPRMIDLLVGATADLNVQEVRRFVLWL